MTGFFHDSHSATLDSTDRMEEGTKNELSCAKPRRTSPLAGPVRSDMIFHIQSSRGYCRSSNSQGLSHLRASFIPGFPQYTPGGHPHCLGRCVPTSGAFVGSGRNVFGSLARSGSGSSIEIPAGRMKAASLPAVIVML